MDRTYSFKNRELITITKNAGMLLYSSLFWNSVQHFKTALALLEHENLWFSLFFTSSSPWKFSCHSSFNLARSTSSFYWCYIFSFGHSWSLHMKERKTHGFFFYLGFLLRRFANHHYHFHLLHRHLDISRAITAESSPLHVSLLVNIRRRKY